MSFANPTTLKKFDAEVDGVQISYDVMRDMKMHKFDKLISYLADSESQQSKEDVKNLFPLHPYTAFLCSSLADHNGNQTMRAYYSWSSESNIWIGSEKFETPYDNHGNRTLFVSYLWDFETNAWIDRLTLFGVEYAPQYEYTYDNNGKIISTFTYYWENNERKNLGKAEYEHNGNGTVIVGYEWSSEKNEWVVSRKAEYTYVDKNPVLVVYHTWNSENKTWVKSSKYEYTYNDKGNETSRAEYVWNAENNTWIGKNKHEYIHTNFFSVVIQYIWNETNNEWEDNSNPKHTFDNNGNLISSVGNSSKTEYAYNDNGNLTMHAYYTWTNNEWIGRGKTEYAYDNNGNSITNISYRWINNTWEFGSKTETKYDLSVLVNDIFCPYISYNKPIEGKWYEWTGNAWQEKGNVLYYYSNASTNIPNVSATSISIFPNPVFDNFTINGIEEQMLVTIFDISGKIVLQKTVLQNETVSVAHLTKGIYFVNVNGEVVKVVKK